MKRGMIKNKGFRNKLRTLEWDPRNFDSRAASEEGSIINVMSSSVVIQKENTIKHLADKMTTKGVRRVFVTDPDKTLRGVVTAKDIVNFLGGGKHFNLVKKKYRGDIIAASNEHIREIMSEKVIFMSHRSSMEDALIKLCRTGFGGLAVLENEKVIGVVTENDFTALLSKHFSGKNVKDYMSKKVIFGTSGMKIKDISKVMVRNGFRRIPILEERALVGIVTTFDIVKRFSTNLSQNILDTRISKIMKKPITTEPDELIENAALLMRKNKMGGLPVVKEKRVVGMVTNRDLLRLVM